MASRFVEWCILACFPAGVFLLLGLLEVPSFVDPCHAWEAEGPPPGSTGAAACTGHTSSPESRMQAASRLLLFQGTTLIGLVLALVGAVRERRMLVGSGAGVLGAISVPLLTMGVAFVFPLASAVLFGAGLLLFPAAPAARLRGP